MRKERTVPKSRLIVLLVLFVAGAVGSAYMAFIFVPTTKIDCQAAVFRFNYYIGSVVIDDNKGRDTTALENLASKAVLDYPSCFPTTMVDKVKSFNK